MDINFEEIKKALEKQLKPKRFEHTLNVVKESIRLCDIYGGNVSNTSHAALLHDCAKSFKGNELISFAETHGYKIDTIQQQAPELLHGPIGALYAKENFNIFDEDILNAITFHTTGRANMSLMEKIIYLADMTEEGRDFPELKEIRAMSSRNLDTAIFYACNCTLNYIIKNNLLLHPLTIELRNSLIIGGSHTYE